MNLPDLIFPKRCVGCGRIGTYFCARCAATIRIIEPNEAVCPVCEKLAIDGATHPRCKTRFSLDGLTSFFRYDGVVKKAVKALKYRFVSDLAMEFVSLAQHVSFLPQRGDNERFTLVPIPLHSMRLRQRGFNQAVVLGGLVAEKLSISMCTDILKRTGKTTPQVEMRKRKERLENMKNVFTAFPDAPESRNIAKVLLFDDVFTTGATMRAAGSALKRAGIKQVWAVTMAR